MSKVVRIMELLLIFIFPSTSSMWWNPRQMQAKWPSAGKWSPILCQNDVLQSLLRHLLWIIDLRREGRGKNPAHLSTAHSPAALLRVFHHRPRSISQCLPQNKNAKVRGVHGAGGLYFQRKIHPRRTRFPRCFSTAKVLRELDISVG